ncbi:ATP-binding protein [Oligoflexus tunisiensis]|uniref:ATP-binding protein n=1 Tax=Oligoflexus tunisiensis TaxID=708132 RepID=UPI000B01AE8E|nr:ATP-binding protein [Oligoflexus tunisiensis]
MYRINRPYSLSWHLVALVLAAMIPSFIFSALMVNWLGMLERQATERHLRREAQKLMVSVDQEFTTAIRTLQALSASRYLEYRNLKAFHEDLQHIQKTQPSWETILLHDAKGQILLSAARTFGNKLIASVETESLQEVISTGKPVIGHVVQAPPEGRFANRYVFAVRIPVLVSERVVYVLSAVISVDRIQMFVSDSIPDEWTRTVIDPNGRVVARSRSPETFVGKYGTPSYINTIRAKYEGLIRETTLEGKAVYIAFDRSPVSGWTSSIAVPVEALEDSARHSMRLVITIESLLLLIFGGLAVFYSRRLAHRIRSAATGAMALAEGKVPMVEKSVVTEVEQLRTALVTVADLLRERERERNEHLQQAQAARAEAEQANRAKSEFLANMSHELRTPLGVVLGFSELLTVDNIAPEEKAENLQIIQRNGQHLLRLIDDILDLSKVEARRLSIELQDFSLPDLLSGVMADLKPQAVAKGIDLLLTSSGKIPEMIHSDPIRLRQIISNIVGNAIKFTQKGQVALTVQSDEPFLILTIRDTGIGLTSEQQKRLFQPFMQADSSHTRKYGGTGLGLALCKRLAELLGGDIHLLASKPGEGSTFQVRVKYVRP